MITRKSTRFLFPGKAPVRDSRSGDYILKLANLLPVAVIAKINLADLAIVIGDAKLTVLQGEVIADKAKPEDYTITVSPEFEYSMPSYSFPVIRMRSRKNN